MAGSEAHWRDVISNAAWQQLLQRTEHDPAHMAHVAGITQALTAYHALVKPSAAQFGARRTALDTVRQRALTYVNALEQEVAKGHVHKGRAGVHKAARKAAPGEAQVIDGPLDPWVRSVERRALKKSEYLRLLGEYYASTKAREVTAEDFRRYLATKHEHDRAGSSTLPLTAGTKFEKFDPMHRQSEVHVDDNGAFQMAEGVDIPMNTALREWIESHLDIPFFVWLEGHPICTRTRYLDPDWKSVLRVKYGAEPSVLELVFRGGQVRARPRDDDAVGVPLDTSTMAKGSKPGLAFVWCVDGTLLVHRHQSGTFHHSSFQAGRKVRCAGTLIAANGKITHIDTDSGHYRPTDRHFLTLFSRLRRANCLALDATVATFASNQLANPALARANNEHMQTSDEYERWAREHKVKAFPLVRPLRTK